jgi:hypothetical protein
MIQQWHLTMLRTATAAIVWTAVSHSTSRKKRCQRLCLAAAKCLILLHYPKRCHHKPPKVRASFFHTWVYDHHLTIKSDSELTLDNEDRNSSDCIDGSKSFDQLKEEVSTLPPESNYLPLTAPILHSETIKSGARCFSIRGSMTTI